jgi:hypothetical protein
VLWKLATAGGQPVQLLDRPVYRARVAADGRSVAAFWQPSEGSWEIGLISPEGGLTRRRPLPPGTDIVGGLRLTDDGLAVDLVRVERNVNNLWRVPLDGGAPIQLTHFESDHIRGFDWSRDGRLLAIIRGGWRGDVVLLNGAWNGPDR